jgi:hypothetical protein
MRDIGVSDNGDVLYTDTELVVAVITSNEQR